MMRLLASSLVAVLAFVSGLGVRAETATTLSYDTKYDNPDLPLDQVACSDGANGLETKNSNYKMLGSLPNFPNVGGVYTVSGWNSTECGACYAVTYGSSMVNILAVDASKSGFTISRAAMDALTDNHATERGNVDVFFVQVDPSDCGMPTSS